MATTQAINIDGIAYHTSLSGPADGPAILLVHALMSNHHMFDSTIPALHNAGYRTLAFDHLGHNLTPPPSDPTQDYSSEDIVQRMHALVLATTGSPKLHAVIGCSIGGVLALRYSMHFPDDVVDHVSGGYEITPDAARRALQRNREQLCQETVARWLPGDTPHDAAVRAEALKHCTVDDKSRVQDMDQSEQRNRDQQELSRMFKQLPEGHRGLLALGPDGVFRSLTGDREVVGAVGLQPTLIKALLDRGPLSQEAEDKYRGVDGTKVPVDRRWKPERSILPPALTEAEIKEEEEFAALHSDEIKEVEEKRAAGA
ncbi:hypothetical protein LTR95_014786 [Oleoguttula sp. CCFEE 5521]